MNELELLASVVFGYGDVCELCGRECDTEVMVGSDGCELAKSVSQRADDLSNAAHDLRNMAGRLRERNTFVGFGGTVSREPVAYEAAGMMEGVADMIDGSVR